MNISCSNSFRWQDVISADIFIILLPGAFTPTCSTYQLPGFENNTARFIKS